MDSPVIAALHKQGYLVKKGHIRHSWRTRWFVLSKNSLEYFKTRQDTKSKGKIPLLGASLNCPVYTPSSTRPWMLIVTTVDGKEYCIQAPDKESRDEWKLALEENIRRLDPSKRSLNKRGVTMSRSLTGGESPSSDYSPNQTELVKQKDIIEAMQDTSAGIKLHELRRGRLGRHVDKYFTGSAAVDWLLTWYFATTRPEAITLCNSMLGNGLFHAIMEEDSKNGFVTSIAKDRQACHQFEDSESARYIFLSFVSRQSVEKLLFNDIDEVEDQQTDGRSNGYHKDTPPSTSPSSPESPSPSNLRMLNHYRSLEDVRVCSIQTQDIIRQGYLLKQGHLRKNWKIRRFVLKETSLEYYRVEKIKTKPQGIIQLSGSTVSIYDERDHRCSPPVSPGRPKRHSLPPRLRTNNTSPTITRPHMFCIETENHIKYIIQAESDDERLQWMADIAKQIDMASLSSEHRLPTTSILSQPDTT